MRTWFQQMGTGRILAGAGFLVFSAALGGCMSQDKPKPKPLTTSPKVNTTANSTGTNGTPANMNSTSGQIGSPGANATPGLNSNPGLSPNSTGANRTSSSISDGSNRIGMTSGAMGPNGLGGSPNQFGQGPANPNGLGNAGNPGAPIATSGNNGVRQAAAAQVNMTGVQPLDPTPGMPPPVVTQNSDRAIRPAFQKPTTPPPMDGSNSSDGGIQPVQPVQSGSRQ